MTCNHIVIRHQGYSYSEWKLSGQGLVQNRQQFMILFAFKKMNIFLEEFGHEMRKIKMLFDDSIMKNEQNKTCHKTRGFENYRMIVYKSYQKFKSLFFL